MFECEWIAVLVEGERINIACLSRVLRLTMLAPEIVERMLDGRQLTGVQMDVLRSFPVKWERQGTPGRVPPCNALATFVFLFRSWRLTALARPCILRTQTVICGANSTKLEIAVRASRQVTDRPERCEHHELLALSRMNDASLAWPGRQAIIELLGRDTNEVR